MAANLKTLVQGTQIAGSATLYFTATAKTVITAMTLTNTTGTSRSTTVYLVPNGGSAGASNTIGVYNVIANTQRVVAEAIGQTLEVGDMIYATCAAATAVTLRASGVEQS